MQLLHIRHCHHAEVIMLKEEPALYGVGQILFVWSDPQALTLAGIPPSLLGCLCAAPRKVGPK